MGSLERNKNCNTNLNDVEIVGTASYDVDKHIAER